MIADIHFQPRYVFAAIDAGCAAVRVNPGNIKKFDDQVGEIAKAAVGGRDPDPDRRQRRLAGQAAAGQVRQGRPPRRWWSRRCGSARCSRSTASSDIKISVKHHDPVVMIEAYRQLAAALRLPAAPRGDRGRAGVSGHHQVRGRVRRLLAEGIGDTIRVSLSAPPVEEVKVGIQILESLGLRQRSLEIVSCPSCGRAQVDVYTLAERGAPPAWTGYRCRCASR